MFSGLAIVVLAIATLLGAGRWLRRGKRRAELAREETAQAIVAFEAARAELANALNRSRANGATRLHEAAPLLARDSATGELVALAPIAAEDSPQATAVFSWRRDRWRTDGRVISGLAPAEAYRRHRNRLVAA